MDQRILEYISYEVANDIRLAHLRSSPVNPYRQWHPTLHPGGLAMDASSLIIDLISGAVGGNAAGAAMPDKSLGLSVAASAVKFFKP
jgi:hypothetical protein